jgi:putative spermidine/putrescine transport system permease protein
VVALFLAAPIIVVAGVSLNEQKTLQFPPQGLSFEWYRQIVADPGWRGASLNSLLIAVTAAALSVLIAFPLVWSQWRRYRLWARAFEVIGLTPFILPPVITALGFLSFWATLGLYGAPWTIVISHAIFFVTLPLVTLTLGFASIDRAVVEAARTMGADDRALLRTIVLPLVAPYIISGYAFAFVLSLNEYIIAYMVAGFTTETLPIKIFNSLRYGYTPTMAAVTIVFVLLAVLVFGLIARFGDLPRLLGAWAREER